ncbi:MAG TPA: hypothetical protein VFK73_02310, partial [Paludibacter sp.]|nr:hypothetical protein [Paludibacter sp.]
MKKNIFLFASAFTLLFALNSCKKDVLDLDKNLKFSTQTVEQQKQTIEQNGIDFINKVDAMQNTKAMIALQAFSSNTGGPDFVKPLAQLRANLSRNDVKALETFNTQMKAAAIGEDFWGTWTWNPSIEDFDYVAGPANVATILFPATENSLTNNGELKITYVESSVVAPDSDPVEYMPKSISVVLKVSGTVAMTADFSGSYKADGTPTKVTQTLVIEKYNWKLEFTNDDKDVSAKYAFNYDTDVLVKFEIGAAGSFTATNIENSMNDGSPENVFSSGAVYFQVMNIAFLGGFDDFKGFANTMKAIEYVDDRTTTQKEADALNKYLKMYGYFVKEKRKFADVEFYTADVEVPDQSKSTLVYTTTGSNYVAPTVIYDYCTVNTIYNPSTESYDYTYKYYMYGTKAGY